MFKNQYDTDITTWSPDGKLYQVEYAMEAVKQGSCAVGVKNKRYVCLGSLKRSPHTELSSYQSKLFQVSEGIGIALAGLAADGRVLSRYMRRESLEHQYVYGSALSVSKLVGRLGKKSQKYTQRSGRRAFGVGLLVAGHTHGKPKLYQTCPSGNIYDYKGIAIGARSQSARTYIEKNVQRVLDGEERKELILHCLRALMKTTTENENLNIKNTEVSIVGKDLNYTMLDDKNLTEELMEYLEILKKEEEEEEDGGGGGDEKGKEKMDTTDE